MDYDETKQHHPQNPHDTTNDKSLNYQLFKQQTSNKYSVPNYYQYLLTYAENIILDIGMRGQSTVAKELGLSPTKLSHIKDLLIAHINITSKDLHDITKD